MRDRFIDLEANRRLPEDNLFGAAVIVGTAAIAAFLLLALAALLYVLPVK